MKNKTLKDYCTYTIDGKSFVHEKCMKRNQHGKCKDNILMFSFILIVVFLTALVVSIIYKNVSKYIKLGD